jgi:hypothetical protein
MRRLSDDVGIVFGPLRLAGEGAIVGGGAADRLQRTLDDTARSLDRCTWCLSAVADLATTRAAACTEFTEAMAAYRAALERWTAELDGQAWFAVTERPWPPARPGPWAEEG